MSRLLRIQYPGAIYHAMARGVERRKLFGDARDYERFLHELDECVETFAIRLYAFCLFGTHYHLLFETPHGNLSEFMQSLQTRYVIYFNRRHRRWGHLMQGRYKAKLVEGDSYLLRLSRYMHLNPVATRAMLSKAHAERRKALRDYRWSSYRTYVGMGKELKYVSYGPLRALVPDPAKNRRRVYRQYVELGLAETDKEWEEEMKRSALAIGSSTFVDKVKGWYMDIVEGTEKKEDVSLRRTGEWLGKEDVKDVVLGELQISEEDLLLRRGGGLYRAMLARMLIKYGGWKQREVPAELGLGSGAAISMGVKTLEKTVHKERAWQRAQGRIEGKLVQRLKGGRQGHRAR